MLKEDVNGERGSNGHMKDSLVHMFDVFFWTFIPQTWRIEWSFPPWLPTPGFLWQCVWGVIDHHLKRIQDAQNELADVREQVARGPGDL